MKLRAPRLVRRLLAVSRWGAHDDDMDQEMAFHIEAMTREYLRSGMSEADAARAARQRFGSVLRHKEAGHDVRTAHLDQLADDVKSGFRQLLNARGFAFVAVITLALGIGANTAIFSLVNTVMLRGLPVDRPGEIVSVSVRGKDDSFSAFSYPNYTDFRDRNEVLSGLLAYRFVPRMTE